MRKKRFTDVIEGEHCLLYPNKDKTDYYYICTHIDVISIECNILTSKVQIELQYYFSGEYRTFMLSRENLVKSRLIIELCTLGIDITDKNADMILSWLLFREIDAPMKYFHTELGWKRINGELVFLLDKAISVSGIVSVYRGDLKVGPFGDRQDHIRLLKNEVIDNPALSLVYNLGFAAIVSSRLNELVGHPMDIYHLWGPSSTGKTVSAMTAASTIAYPSKAKGGCIRTWMSTANGLSAYLKGKNGFIVIFDEASLRYNQDYTQIIYSIHDGFEKARSNVDGDLKPSGTWTGICLSTGENSMIAGSKKSEGLRVRVLEVGNIPFTSSAENARVLANELPKSYGHTAENIIRKILEIGDVELLSRYEQARIDLFKIVETRDKFTDRTIDKIACVKVAMGLANESLEVTFDITKSIKILLDAELESIEDRNIGEKAYRYLLDMATKYQGYFYRWQKDPNYKRDNPDSESVIKPNEVYGRIDYVKDEPTMIYFECSKFEKLLADAGYVSTKVVLDALYEKGYLKCSEEKNGKRKAKMRYPLYRKSPSTTQVYAIKPDTSSEEEVDEPKRRPMKIAAQRNSKKTANQKFLDI